MRPLLFLFLLAPALKAQCQVVADPATGQMDITNAEGIAENANFLAPARVVKLKIPVYNLNQLNTMPAGTCKFKIGLGHNMALDPAFSLATAPLNAFFTWTAATVSGEVIITGDLKAPLPGDFTGVAEFGIKGTVPGTSEISTDFEVTNHNTATPLTDEDLNNNQASLQYTVTNQTIPVTFTAIHVSATGCTVHTSFSAEGEINVKQYEIEYSTDGNRFLKAGEVKANNNINYTLNFNITNTTVPVTVFVRVKSVDFDGKFKFSETRMIRGVCGSNANISLGIYPNPATSQSPATIYVKEGGVLNGHYFLTLSDMTGRALRKTSIALSNAKQFSYTLQQIPSGNYILTIKREDGSSVAILKAEKS